MDKFAKLTGPPIPPVRLRRRPRCRARDHPDGLRRRGGARDASSAGRRRARRSASSRCASTGRSRRAALRRGAPEDGQGHRGARPHQGAGRARRAAVLDVMTALARGLADGKRRSGDAAGRRRPLRSVVQGVHPGAWSRRCFDELEKPQPKNHFTVGIVDDVTHTRLEYDRASRTEPDDVVRAHVLRARLGRHRGREQELDQDHRRGDPQLRPGLLRLRLEEGRRDDRVAPALRARADPLDLPGHAARTSWPATSSRSSRSTTCSKYASTAPRSCSTARTARTRSGTSCRSEVQQQIIDKKLQVLRHRRLQGGQAKRAWARASTRSCRPASSPSRASCRATRPSRRSRSRSRRPTAQGRGRGREELQGGRPDAGQPAPGRGPGHRHRADRACRRPSPTRRPNSSATSPREIIAGRGDKLPVAPSRSTAPARPAPRAGKSATSRCEIPVWDDGALHPVRQVRAGLPARRHPRQGLRPPTLSRRARRPSRPSTQGQGLAGHEVHACRSAPEDCTGCEPVRSVCPAKDKTNAGHKALNMAPQMPLRDAGARELGLLPDAARGRPPRRQAATRQGRASCCEPLFEFSGACAGCGETPYVKLLTQLFGDRALIANATGCSSIYGGNLPTTPYAPNNDGRGPAWTTRSSRTTRSSAWFPAAVDKQDEYAREICSRAGATKLAASSSRA